MSLPNLDKIAKIVERYMVDSVSISVPDYDNATTDPVTLLLTIPTTDIYSGEAFVAPEGSPYPEKFAERWSASHRFEVAIPKASDPVPPNAILTVTDSKYNPEMIGMELLVVGQIESTFFTHRRLTCIKREEAE